MDPGGADRHSVLRADRMYVTLDPDVTTDVADFEAALAAASRARDTSERAALLSSAADVYSGELLPGYYEPWVLAERERLAQAYLTALRELTTIYQEREQWSLALDAAYRVVAAEPLEEDGWQSLIRLLAATGQSAAAVRQYHEMERRLQEALGETPSEATHDLVRGLLEEACASAARRSLDTVPPAIPAPGVPPRGEASAPPLPASAVPVPLTAFFGRANETGELSALLRSPSCRLVTITGIGGAGKTRIALETARDLRHAFSGGVWFVALADITAPSEIPGAIAAALGYQTSAPAHPAYTEYPIESVIRRLRQQPPSLLVLDNFEHLMEGVSFVRSLLDQIPGLTCLVTSRRRLLLSAEREFALGPLPTPAHPGTPERLLEFASVQLFADRARAALPSFQVTAENAEAVARLCHWLEGIPLALELAAARSGVLTPHQMLLQMNRRFDFLTSRHRDTADRHRTLRAAVDWSYEMLLPSLQDFFAHLSVFQGGWTAEAAEAVTGDCDRIACLDALECLKDLSLAQTMEVAGNIRFRYLEMLREFAWEHLDAATRPDLVRRHSDYFVGLCCAAESALSGPAGNPERELWLRRLQVEQENIEAALLWRASSGDKERANDAATRRARTIFEVMVQQRRLTE
jgi:predicted ATPase